MAERRGQVAVKDLPPKLQKKLRRQKIMPKKARKLNRSMAGNALLFTLMFICGVFMALPLVMIINNALKPLDELYQFPPKIFVRNPNLRNFSDLFILMNDSWVPFSRYIMNTIIITVAGMVGHVIVASWAAYPLAKDKFPGKALLFGMVVLSMMFNWTVTQIPQYAIISWLHINNTYLALILPAWSFGMGLYLMKQFMEQLPDSLMESARVQGANEWQIFWKIVMPNVKPAWLTLAIFQFQQMWGNTGSLFLRDEQLKPMQYALQQITAGGVSRAGAAAAVTFIIMAMTYVQVAREFIAAKMDMDMPTIFEEPQLPTRPYSPSTMKNTVLGFLLGLLLMCGIVVVQFLADDRVRNADKLEKQLGLATIGMMPVQSYDLSREHKNGKEGK